MRTIAFPAYAGMFLRKPPRMGVARGFPRVCGDVSRFNGLFNSDGLLSPRMRGCFPSAVIPNLPAKAFPAYAGMFPNLLEELRQRKSFPRVCGDVSVVRDVEDIIQRLSPRMRGCFYTLL